MSKLPIEKSLDDVRTMIFSRVEEVQDEYQAKGWLPRRLNLNKGVVRGLLELFCWGLYQLYALLQTSLPQAFPQESSGAWLDLHADQVGLTRKTATKARGVVYLTREDTSGNVPVKAGRILRTQPDGTGAVHRFVTTKAVVFPDGASEVAVPIEAEDYGAAANVTVGQINEIVTHIDGVTAVENRADWLTSEGADGEIDQHLGQRYVLRWKGNNSSNRYAYASWALTVPGVVAVRVMDQHPRGQGTVDVVVKGAAGIPTQELLDKVSAAVATAGRPAEENASPPINDDWLVKAPTAVGVAIEAELTLLPGTHEATALAAAEARLRALFEDPNTVDGVAPLQIGDDLPVDRLTAAVMAVPGVKKVGWAAPAADVVVDGDGLAVLTGLDLTAAEAVEA